MKMHFACPLVLVASSLWATPLRFAYQELVFGNAFAINNRGWVAGTADYGDGRFSPFRYRPGVGVERLSENNGHASDINEAGVVVGSLYVGDRLPTMVWMPEQEGNELPDDLEGGSAASINEAGKVVGTLRNHRPFLYTPGQGTVRLNRDQGGAGDINQSGQVVGWIRGSFVDGDAQAFLYTPDLGISPLFSATSTAVAINDAGYITGRVSGPDFVHRAFLRAPDGGLERFGGPDNQTTEGRGINDANWVVGWYNAGAGDLAFLWTPEHGFQDLNEFIPGFDRYGYFSVAEDINDRGQIVGHVELEGRVRAFMLTPVPVPEPDTVVLFPIGLLAFMGVRRYSPIRTK
jgi:hypothetical protein